MANQAAQQNKIDLTSALNTSRNKCEIAPFAGFNKRENPFINNALSPLFKGEKEGLVDKFGNVYTVEMEGGLYGYNYNVLRNNEIIYTGERKIVSDKQYSKPAGTVDELWCIDSTGNPAYVDKNNLIHYRNATQLVATDKQILCINYSYGFIIVTTTTATSSAGSTPKYNFLFIEEANDWKTNLGHITNIPLNITPNTVIAKKISYSGLTDYDLVIMVIKNSKTNYTIYGKIPKDSRVGNISYAGKHLRMPDTTDMYEGTFDGFGILEGNTGINIHPDKVGVIITGVSLPTDPYTDNSIMITASAPATPTWPFSFSDYTAKASSFYDGYRKTFLVKTYSSSGEAGVCARTEKYCKNMPTSFYVYGNDINTVNAAYTDKWFRILYNNNTASGISVVNKKDSSSTIGKLVTPFTDVNTTDKNISITEDQTKLIYFDSNNTAHILSIKEELPTIRLYGDYVVSDSINALAYDTVNEKVIPFFIDWNNSFHGFTPNNSTSSFYKEPRVMEIATAYNAGYQITRDKVSSAIFNPTLLQGVQYAYMTGYTDPADEDMLRIQVGINVDINIDIYITKKAMTPSYTKTIKNKYNTFIKDTLRNTTYPVSTDGNVELAPSMFGELHSTPLNDDYIKENNYCYNVVYWEQEPYMLYWYASGIKNVAITFITQGQRYALKNNIIYTCSYNNQILSNFEPVVNIGDSIFIGCNQLEAVFFSNQNKQFYTFGGDRLLNPAGDGTEISAINATGYCTTTNTIYAASADKVYCFYPISSTTEVYTLDVSGVKQILEMEDGSMIFVNDEDSTIYSLYQTNNAPDKTKVVLSTGFYGNGNNVVSILDCVYLRLYSDAKEDGDVKIKTTTITNIGTENKEVVFHITKEMWDETTNTFLKRFQLNNQRSVGTMFEIESDFAIYELQISSKPDTVQITTNAKGGI